MMFEIRPCSRETFVAAITDAREDNFAKTFVAKADMLDQWSRCVGMFDVDGNLLGAILWTYSKRQPIVCNLQLLHTFHAHRGKGVARKLTMLCIQTASNVAQYFRVSSEVSAIPFYEKVGLKFWGAQKSGCMMCMFRFPGEYDLSDQVIYNQVFKKGKGGVVKLSNFGEAQLQDIRANESRLPIG
jgi:GNAT superfamily N-acetyltransferase